MHPRVLQPHARTRVHAQPVSNSKTRYSLSIRMPVAYLFSGYRRRYTFAILWSLSPLSRVNERENRTCCLNHRIERHVQEFGPVYFLRSLRLQDIAIFKIRTSRSVPNPRAIFYIISVEVLLMKIFLKLMLLSFALNYLERTTQR